MNNSLPDASEIRKILRYEPDTGKLYWRERSLDGWSADARTLAGWNTRYAGTEAFTAKKPRGYLRGSIFGKQYVAHRVAWVIWYGRWPDLHVDHIDGDTGNNRIDNLREASRSQNMRNCKSANGSTSSYLGVSWKSATKKWCAQIQARDGKKHIGYFHSEEEAARAYDRVAFMEGGEFARLNFPEVVAEADSMGQSVTLRLDPLAAKKAVA